MAAANPPLEPAASRVTVLAGAIRFRVRLAAAQRHSRLAALRRFRMACSRRREGKTTPRSAVIALLLLACATAASAQAPLFDPQVPNPAFPEGKGPRILYDTGHFNEWHLEDMSPFLELLRRDGFRVSFLKEQWSSTSFEGANVLVVQGPLAVPRNSLIEKGIDHYWWSDEGRQDAFTSDEILAVTRWLRSGGSLLLILDHAPSAAAAGRLTEALGVEVRNSMTWDAGRRPPLYTYKSDNLVASFIFFSREHKTLGHHPILEGRNEQERVSAVATYVGSSMVGPLDSCPLLLLSPDAFDYFKDPPERGGAAHRVTAAGRAQAVAFSLEKGRVAVVGEYTPFHASWGGRHDPDGIGKGMAYPGADDQQFVLNTVRWLARILP